MSNMTGRNITRRVDDTKEGRAIAAYVVLRADGTHVANITSRRAPSGALLVNVVNLGADNPDTPRRCQWARCGGGGYDKFAHAVNGMSVDGHVLAERGPFQLVELGYRVIQAL